MQYLAAAAVRLHLSPKEALMLTPGMFNDMMELLTPRKEAEDGD